MTENENLMIRSAADFSAHLGEHEGSYPQASCSEHEGEHEVSTKLANPRQYWVLGEHETEHYLSRRVFVLKCSLLKESTR